MKDTSFFLSYLGLIFNDSKISLLTRNGMIALATYSEDEYSWKLEPHDLELESLNQDLQIKVKGQIQLIDGTEESVRHSLMMDLSGMLQKINTSTHEEYLRLQKTCFNKTVESDFINDSNNLIKYLVDVLESPAINDFKLNNEWINSTWKNAYQMIQGYQRFQDYDNEFQIIHKKITDIKGENEDLAKKKENFEENYNIFKSGKVLEGQLFKEDFRMGKDQVINLLSNKYSSFDDVIGALG